MRCSEMGAVRAASSGVNRTTEAIRSSGLRRRAAFSLMKAVSCASVGFGAAPAMAWVTSNQRPSRVSKACPARSAP